MAQASLTSGPETDRPVYAQDALDPSEIRVLNELALGYTDTSAAAHLGISVRTLHRRLRSVMDKLGATSRFQAGMRYERIRADRLR